uniref:Retrotransposon protein, putative, unclassified n=1 Tax=Tanacetum cinerariifolium TaxID=118510 RepID=A0A6L2NAG5_TANCI|nr:retrotransposon protein, putative, unclassified [Tanacetum cinerariifolium]
MHNNIMAAGSRDRPPVIATGRYAQWRSRFLRYIDTRPNGDALRNAFLKLRKCRKLSEGYNKVNPSTFKMSRQTYFGIATMQVNVQFLQQLQPEWSRFVMIVKQQHKLDEVSYHKLFDILKQYQKEVNELHAERIARNANPLALVATDQPNQDLYYQTPKPHKPYAPTSKASILTRSHATTRNKGKEIAKPITPPYESDSKEDSDPEQAQRYKDMQKKLVLIAKYFKRSTNLLTTTLELLQTLETRMARVNVGSPVVQQSRIHCFNYKEFGHFAKECRKPKRVKDSAYHKEKMLLCKQAEKDVPLQADYMAKIQEVPKADSGTNSEPLEQVQYNDEYNVFANMNQHCEKSKSTNERDALANLIANFKLDVDGNKKIQKQLKKANTSLAHELEQYKSILAKTSKTLKESNSVRDSCLVALQTKQTEFEKYKACNDRTVDYDKLERVNHKTNVSRPQHRRAQIKDKFVPNNSQVKLKKTEVEDHPRIPSISNKTKSVTACNDSLNSRTSNVNAVCATCGKCLIDLNHFACVTKMLNDVNARTKKPNVMPISTRNPKSQAKKSVAKPRKKTVASETTTQKSKSYYRMLHEKTSKTWTWWIEQQCPSDTTVLSQQELDLLFGPLYDEFFNADTTVLSQQELDLLFGPLYDEFFNAGLQIRQSPRGIFINQAKYALEILKKHGMEKGQSIGTPMATKPKLDADLSGKIVDQTDYRSKIRSLMYLTSSRPDTVQASAIEISCNLVQHSRIKHIHTRYHFIKEQVEDGIIELYFVKTEYQLADMFTKALLEDMFKYLVRRIVEENEVTKPKKYSELSTTEAIQADCDVKATNIILQGLPPEVYALYASQAQSSTPLSITYPSNDFQSSVNHSVYNLSSSIPQVEYAPSVHQQSEFSQPDTGLVVPVFQKETNSLTAGMSRQYTSRPSGTLGKQRVIVCYNCKGEGHMSKQCKKPKRKRDEAWFKDKVRILKEQDNVDKASESYAQSLEIDNLKHTISKHLKEKESLVQMKQKDPMMSEKKVNTKPVDYATLNQLSQDFETRFVPQTELSAEQAFWAQNSGNSAESNLSSSTTIVEVLKELPKVSMVNSSLEKLKFHLASFDMVFKERTTATAITEGMWGFEHTKACFRDEVIQFLKALKELFNSFDQFLIDELTEV